MVGRREIVQGEGQGNGKDQGAGLVYADHAFVRAGSASISLKMFRSLGLCGIKYTSG